MTTTNQIEQPTKKFSLDQLTDVMLDRKNIPVGFFVSQKLWDTIEGRWRLESGRLELGAAPQMFNGTRIAVDPALPDLEFDVAFTEESWSKRLRGLRA